MFAVIKTGGKQYRVAANDLLKVEKVIGEAGDVDTAAVQMQTASGRIAVITNSRRATYGHDQRIEVHGSKGMLRAGNIHLTTLEKADSAGFTSDLIPFFFTERYADAYRIEINAFLTAIEKGEAPGMRPGWLFE